MADRETEFREKHESLTRRLGRCPTRTEICGAMGWNLFSSHCYQMAKRLGLQLTAERQRKEKAPKAKKEEPSPSSAKPAIPPVDVVHDFGHRAAPNMMRIYEIRNGDALGEGKGWGHGPSEGYGVTERKMITCPVCSSRKLIAPRMHPFWLRNRLGKVVFVCSRACTGQHVT